jgi:predicted phosphodiesterase
MKPPPSKRQWVRQYLLEHPEAAGLTCRELAGELGVSKSLVAEVQAALRGSDMSTPLERLPFDDTTDRLREWFGDSWQSYRKPKPHSQNHRNVCAIGDIHSAPNTSLVNQIVERNPDVIVLGGDLLDGDKPNRHVKLPEDPAPRTVQEEIGIVRAMAQFFLDRTDADLKVVRGNHDDRWFKKVAEVLDDDELSLFIDPLKAAMAGLPRTELVKIRLTYQLPDSAERDFGETNYMYNMGDVLLSHANFTGSNAGDAVRKLLVWMDRWRRTLNIDPSIFVQFHSHGQAWLTHDGGNVILIEPGMGCDPAAEAWKVRYDLKWKPGVLGALYFEQDLIGDRWVTDRRTLTILKP